MADNQNATANEAKAKNSKTVVDDMDRRRIVATTDEAAAYLMRCVNDYDDFVNYDLVAPGLSQDENGAFVFDPAIYTADMRVMICYVAERNGIGTSQIKAIVINPVPTLESILADQAGMSWLNKIVDTALNAAAVRPIRKPDAKATDPEVLEAMPKTLADYVTSSGGGSSALLEAYEELWRPIKAALATLSKAFRLANVSKKEFRRSMESSSYAAANYPLVENSKAGSVFKFALDAFTEEGKKQGYDVSIFERWKATRDQTAIDAGDDDDADELTLDLLSKSLTKDAGTEAAGDEPTGTDADAS